MAQLLFRENREPGNKRPFGSPGRYAASRGCVNLSQRHRRRSWRGADLLHAIGGVCTIALEGLMSSADEISVELVPNATGDVCALIGELDRILSAEYTPEQ